jgi:transposase-like protein
VKTKTPVIALVQRGGEIRAAVADNAKMITVEKHIVENAKIGSQLYTDELPSYGRIGKFFPHKFVEHLKGEYVRDGVIHTQTVDSFWALFKRGFHGIYHHMSRKHLQRYVDESTFRFNRRENKMESVYADAIARVAASIQLPYKQLIA